MNLTPTFTDHSVTVPITGPTALTWGSTDSIYIVLRFDCGSSPPPSGGGGGCCPPWNATQLGSMLFYQGTGSVSAAYTLRFNPTAQLHLQMNSYINYLKSLGLGIASIAIKFELFDGGTGPNSTPGSSSAMFSQTLTWTGTGIPTASFFPPGLTNANRWYRVRTTIILNNGPTGYLPQDCLVTYKDVRFQVL